MKIKIEIETENDAFENGYAGIEVARILKRAAEKVRDWDGKKVVGFSLMDLNGNKVGKLESED